VKVNPGLALTVDVPTGPIIDRTFGFHTVGEGDKEVIGYGVPAVEVNKDSDAVVVYQRVGGNDTWPEARYSAYMNGEPDIRPSALLRKGARPLGGNADPDDPDKPIGNADTGGASVDPIGKEAIWVTHVFANSSGGYQMAVGKVFGKPFADIFTIVSKFDLKRAGGVRMAKATIVVGNQGDGRAPGSKLHIFLVPKRGKPKPLGTLRVPPLPAGRRKVIHVDLGLPKGLGSGPFRLRAVLDPSKRIKQYGVGNDAGLSRRADR